MTYQEWSETNEGRKEMVRELKAEAAHMETRKDIYSRKERAAARLRAHDAEYELQFGKYSTTRA